MHARPCAHLAAAGARQIASESDAPSDVEAALVIDH